MKGIVQVDTDIPVDAGDPVQIPRNGQLIADFVPLPHDLPSWKSKTAPPLVIDGCSLSAIILEEHETAF